MRYIPGILLIVTVFPMFVSQSGLFDSFPFVLIMCILEAATLLIWILLYVFKPTEKKLYGWPEICLSFVFFLFILLRLTQLFLGFNMENITYFLGMGLASFLYSLWSDTQAKKQKTKENQENVDE